MGNITIKRKDFSTERRKVYESEYLKVFFKNQIECEPTVKILSTCQSVKKVNVTPSKSIEYTGNTLTIYPKKMYSIEELEGEIVQTLDSYFEHKVIMPQTIVSTPVFENIKRKITEVLNQAVNTIYISVAWFTENDFRNILLEKIGQGVDVKVIINDDDTNTRYGVDFKHIPYKRIKAERNSIMHKKYCVIDNHLVILGSYNWTYYAENRNDENILIIQDWNTANKCTRDFLNDWNNNR